MKTRISLLLVAALLAAAGSCTKRPVQPRFGIAATDTLVSRNGIACKIEYRFASILNAGKSPALTAIEQANIGYFFDLEAFSGTVREAAAAAIGKELMEMAGSEFITITDEKGMVVARGHSPKYGDDVNNQETVSAGRQGKSVVGVVTGTVVPFTLRAGAPLMRDGKVAGTVGIGISLTSEAYVDKLKKDTGLEATIFRDDVRAMTTLMQDGKRLIGTRLQNAPCPRPCCNAGKPSPAVWSFWAGPSAWSTGLS